MPNPQRAKTLARYRLKVSRKRDFDGKKPIHGVQLDAAAKKSVAASAKLAHRTDKRAKAVKARSAKSLESKKKQVVRQAESAYKRGQSEQRQKNWQTTAKWGQAAYASHMLGYAARRMMVEPASKLSRAGDINFTGKK